MISWISQTTLPKLPQSWRFSLYNIRLLKIRPFGTCYTTPCLSSCSVQAELLQWSLGRSSSQFYQTSTTNPECGCKISLWQAEKRVHVTPLFINLHWLPIAACIKFKALIFACKTTTGSTRLYLNSLPQIYVPSRSLCSASEWHIYSAIPKRHKITDLPNSVQAVLSNLQEMTKNTSLHLHLPL